MRVWAAVASCLTVARRSSREELLQKLKVVFSDRKPLEISAERAWEQGTRQVHARE